MSNLYGLIFGKITKQSVAQKFKENGWEIRKSGFNEYEIKSEWSELNLEGENEILINGDIDFENFDKLEKLFSKLDLKYSLEIYDNQGELIKTVANNG